MAKRKAHQKERKSKTFYSSARTVLIVLSLFMLTVIGVYVWFSPAVNKWIEKTVKQIGNNHVPALPEKEENINKKSSQEYHAKKNYQQIMENNTQPIKHEKASGEIGIEYGNTDREYLEKILNSKH